MWVSLDRVRRSCGVGVLLRKDKIYYMGWICTIIWRSEYWILVWASQHTLPYNKRAGWTLFTVDFYQWNLTPLDVSPVCHRSTRRSIYPFTLGKLRDLVVPMIAWTITMGNNFLHNNDNDKDLASSANCALSNATKVVITVGWLIHSKTFGETWVNTLTVEMRVRPKRRVSWDLITQYWIDYII